MTDITRCPENSFGKRLSLPGNESQVRADVNQTYPQINAADILCQEGDRFYLQLDKLSSRSTSNSEQKKAELLYKIAGTLLLLSSSENSQAHARLKLAQATAVLKQLKETDGNFHNPYKEWAKHTTWSIVSFTALTHSTTDGATALALRSKTGKAVIQYFSEYEVIKNILIKQNLCGDPKIIRDLSSPLGDILSKFGKKNG